MKPVNIFLIILFFCLPLLVQAQNKKYSSSKREAIIDLSKSLENEKNDDELAQDYIKLAKELSDKGDYVKAEENLEKARKIYLNLKDKEKQALVERELARVQEQQNKIDQAILNYQEAGRNSNSRVLSKVNVNDASRLQNQSNPKLQSKFIQENITLLDEDKNTSERAIAYKQMAEVNMALNEPEEAIANLENALKDVEDKPAEAVKISREIANVYTKEEKYEKAIEINEKLLDKAKQTENTELATQQLKELALVYKVADESDKAITSLKQAYGLAVEQSNTLEAQKIMELLIEQYAVRKDTLAIVTLYNDFNTKLDTLIKTDSTLIDARIYQVVEDRIARLEKERELKDELIRRKNIFNYVLIGAIFLILLFVAFIIKALFSIHAKNKKIALQSLRREMNPHFIFNSLNSVNQFIAQSNELEANKYLTSYSKLMRNIMENSNKDFIPLSVEITQLKEYLQLEHMRFSDKFEYEISIDEQLDTDAVWVANMLIQPQLENAIWHGLRYRETKGFLHLSFIVSDKNLIVEVDDNGIGLKRSKELKTARQKEHNSRGMKNTQERINLLNDLYNTNITISVTDKDNVETGVLVIIKMPLINKLTSRQDI